MRRFTLMVAVASLSAASAATAQHVHPGATQPRRPATPATQPTAPAHIMADCLMEAMMMPLGHFMAFLPDSLLGHAETLKLDASQEAQLSRAGGAGSGRRSKPVAGPPITMPVSSRPGAEPTMGGADTSGRATDTVEGRWKLAR